MSGSRSTSGGWASKPLRPDPLSWDRVALTGDVGLVSAMGLGPSLSPTAHVGRRLGKRFMLLCGFAWLAWEIAGVARAAAIGAPILKTMWGLS